MNEALITSLHPASLALTLLMGGALLALPRQWAMAPMVIAAIFVPTAQHVVLGGLDFNALRILLLFAFARVGVRGEIRSIRLHSLDWLLFAYAVVMITAYTIRLGTTGALVNRLGWAFDSIGTYLFCRLMLRSPREVLTTVKVAAACSVVLAALMSVEWVTGHNLFSLIGGVPAVSMVREGRIRCQGAFSHPIMAGMFGASWAPLFGALWWYGDRTRAMLGLVSAIAVVVFAASSTPLAGLLIGGFGMALWRYRAYVPMVRNGTYVLLVVLHFVREAPVWQLLARINIVGGSTGWHRYFLIDRAIANFGEWWLIGTNDTNHWHFFLSDVTNEYIAAGVFGGVLAMLLLIGQLVVGFSGLGRAAKSRRIPLPLRRFSWAAGSMLAVHAVSFISVSYFGQMTPIWYLHLAIVAAVLGWYRQALRQQGRSRRPAAARAAALAAPA